jgi:hypothetical protein
VATLYFIVSEHAFLTGYSGLLGIYGGTEPENILSRGQGISVIYIYIYILNKRNYIKISVS